MKKYLKYVMVLTCLLTIFILCPKINTFSSGNPVSLKIEAKNVSYSDSIYLMFAVSSSDTSADVKLLTWTNGNGSYEIGSQEHILENSGIMNVRGTNCLVYCYPLASCEMSEVVYVRAYCNDNDFISYSDVEKYSVVNYAYNKLGYTGTATSEVKLQTLLKKMMEYGGASQDYFNNKKDELVTSDQTFYTVNLEGGLFTDGFSTGLYKDGKTITLYAPDKNSDGKDFSYWKDADGSIVGTSPECDYVVKGKNQTLTAFYGQEAEPPVEPPVSNKPALSIVGASATAGATKVKVNVALENNPGFLTMALNIAYDETALTLTKASNGYDYSDDYSFTAPKNKASGCTAAWFATDLPEEIIDGDLLALQFTVNADAPAGSYPVTISCPKDGSTLDGDKKAFEIESVTGYITVE